MSRILIGLLALTACCGCQEIQVRKKANRLTSTVPDLYYDEVLDNIALTLAKPDAIPYFGIPQQGTNGNTRNVSANYAGAWDFLPALGRYLFDKQSSMISGSNQWQESFQVQPLSDPDKMYLLHVAFQKAGGVPIAPEADDHLRDFYKTHVLFTDYYDWIKPGWFNIANSKRDVPKHACYVGHYCDVYVWVPAENLNDLSQFTLAILDIVTIDPSRLWKPPKAISVEDKQLLETLPPDKRSELLRSLTPQPMFPPRMQQFPYPAAPNYPNIQ